jgi:hypothetical protein
VLINAAGIDVVKGKSMIMALRPMNKITLKVREYPHSAKNLILAGFICYILFHPLKYFSF